MFGKLLTIPFLLMAVIGLFLSWEYIEGWTWLIVVGIVGAAIVYILHPQINWWYYNRRPPEVDTPVREMLERHDPFYQSLSPVARQRFRQRMALFLMGNDFIPQGWEAIPHDVEAAIAAAATKVLWGHDEPIFRQAQRVVVYPQPFPSPAYPEEWHRSEWFAEDGVLLFSGNDLMWSLLKPGQNLDLGLYEYLRVCHSGEPAPPWPEMPEDLWPSVTRVCGWTEAQIRTMIGLQDVDARAVWCTLWFTHPHRMEPLIGGEAMDRYARHFGAECWRDLRPAAA
jgi:hypothetical protein